MDQNKGEVQSSFDMTQKKNRPLEFRLRRTRSVILGDCVGRFYSVTTQNDGSGRNRVRSASARPVSLPLRLCNFQKAVLDPHCSLQVRPPFFCLLFCYIFRTFSLSSVIHVVQNFRMKNLRLNTELNTSIVSEIHRKCNVQII